MKRWLIYDSIIAASLLAGYQYGDLYGKMNPITDYETFAPLLQYSM
jgi:hypothetical protein